MFKRLAPVIELPDSRSQSSSPIHKRSQTQHKARSSNSPQISDSQIWSIIQSRRNLDKKMRRMDSRIKKPNKNPGCPSSPLSFDDSQEIISPRTTLNSKSSLSKIKKEINKENREKLVERIHKARDDIKLQSALDQMFIKKRDEFLHNKKKQQVNSIKNSLQSAKHKRAATNLTLKELSSTDYDAKIQRIAEINKSSEISLKILEEKLKCSSDSRENTQKYMSKRVYSALISPRNIYSI
jgi:hypothetical protein